MPEFAELAVDNTICPHCKNNIRIPSGVVKFQWGKIPHTYKLGDLIVWLKDIEGNIVPAFQMVERRTIFGSSIEWNCGEPKYQDLYVFDTDPNLSDFECSECGIAIEKLVIIVKSGSIVYVHALRYIDLKPELGVSEIVADIIIIQANGSLWERSDWNDEKLR